ncbi:endonuclease [Kocuria tytonicola]|uniref:endonuclease/exonuclease/phosphatase family protein n=1 Tax=Kocuria tytonicola TaxID=2055946 RepID=UPI000EF8C113|nr:endonuclease/exonuclease/phosphatase family protein [Kocuria tytonicola]RLZ02408.1 endonuclease [Kocuria tytonicola]
MKISSTALSASCLVVTLVGTTPALAAPVVPAAAAVSPDAAPSASHGGHDQGNHGPGHSGARLRVATYNASLNRGTQGQLLKDLSTRDNQQARNIAEVIQTNAPDVVLVNEFDYVPGGGAARAFRDNYLGLSQRGEAAQKYPYYYTAPVNTGVPSGLDLDQNGTVGGAGDAWGFGQFPGQYGMVIFSKYPIAQDQVRTFQNFRWQDMPGNQMPTSFYTPEQQRKLRLSSKSHWDVPVRVGKQTVHVLAAHPTPPSFDGPEDRNGRRNHDEIRFWADYVSSPPRARYIYDDAGSRGGLTPGERFVILGDYNSDPHDGDSFQEGINQLLDSPRVRDPRPASTGAVEAAALQGGANRTHRSDPKYDTGDFSDNPAPGNLRTDYVLPSKNLQACRSAVHWPRLGEPGSELTGTDPFPTSDHRLVWLDVRVPGGQ